MAGGLPDHDMYPHGEMNEAAAPASSSSTEESPSYGEPVLGNPTALPVQPAYGYPSDGGVAHPAYGYPSDRGVPPRMQYASRWSTSLFHIDPHSLTLSLSLSLFSVYLYVYISFCTHSLCWICSFVFVLVVGLLSCFCPCVTFGRIVDIVDMGNTSCIAGAGLYHVIMYLTGCACLYSAFFRSKLRAQYRLPESPAPDWAVHFVCEPCALAQEYRELQSRGLDMTIGWQGNLELQRLPPTFPPVVAPPMMRW